MSALHNRGLSRRQVLSALAAGLGALALGACAPQPAAPTAAPTAAQAEKATEPPKATEAPTTAPAPTNTPVPLPTAMPAKSGATNIEFWTAWAGGEIADLQTMVNDFMAKHENIAVKFLGGGPGGGDYNEILLARIASGSAPDVAHLFTPPVGFAARGSLDQVDDLMATAQYAKPGRFWAQVLKTCQYRGKTYGLPFSAGCTGIFYNVDWFAQKGFKIDRESFPKTMDELKLLAKEFVVWEGEELKTGAIVPWGVMWMLPSFCAAFGGQLFNADTLQYTLNHEGNIALLEYWIKWLDEQYKGNVDYLNSVGAWEVYPNTLFTDKRNAFGYGGAWATSYVEMAYNKLFKWDVAKMTAGPNGKAKCAFWPNWFTMPTGGKHKQEAFLLCEYFCTTGMPIWYAKVNDTPAWLDFPREVITKNLVDNVGQEKAKDIHTFFIENLSDAVEMWTSPIEDFGTDQVNRAFDQAMHKVKGPKEALDEAQKITQAKLEETLKSL